MRHSGSLAAGLVASCLGACATAPPRAPWRRPANAWQPRALDRAGTAAPARAPVRVTRRDGRQLVLDSARVAGDSIVGRARPTPEPASRRQRGAEPSGPDVPTGSRVAVALADVAQTEEWQPTVAARSQRAECRPRAADQPSCVPGPLARLVLPMLAVFGGLVLLLF